MFRRTRSPESPESPEPAPAADERRGRTEGKGRPTPSRKEAQAAARARARTPRGRKEQAQAKRQARAESSRKVREAMRTGDDRYLPARDRGPVRRFIRDFVDSRLSFVELLVPVLVLTLVLGYSGQQNLVAWGNALLMGTMLLIVVDLVLLRFRLRRQLARRFPDEPTKGTTYYAITRALQMKFMRLPKSQMKYGQRPPEHYR